MNSRELLHNRWKTSNKQEYQTRKKKKKKTTSFSIETLLCIEFDELEESQNIKLKIMVNAKKCYDSYIKN